MTADGPCRPADLTDTPTFPVLSAPPRQLLVATALAVIAHAMLLLGLPNFSHGIRAGAQGNAFVTRLVAPPPLAAAPAPPDPAPVAQPAVDPPPRPQPATVRRPKPPQESSAPSRPQTPRPPDPSNTPSEAAGEIDPEPNLLAAPPRARFGGRAGPRPIAPPLPTDEARVALEFSDRTEAAPALVAPAAEITYQTHATIAGQTVQLPTVLDWRQDGRLYEVRWVLFSPRFGEHTRTSVGLLAPQGLVPVEATLRTPAIQDVRFDYAARQLRFGAQGADTPLQAGTQDRLSVLLQLGALLAGDAARYPVGTRITLPAAHPRGAGTWQFTVEAAEPVTALQGKELPTLRLVHQPENEQDARIEVWLGRTINYLPVRLRITEPNGDTVEHTMQTAFTQQVPLSAAPPASAQTQ